jgi:hypothetical protein
VSGDSAAVRANREFEILLSESGMLSFRYPAPTHEDQFVPYVGTIQVWCTCIGGEVARDIRDAWVKSQEK